MKKSKIIVPALALLTLSAAASVSGSVAWFTANRKAELDAGNFAVVSTKDNLDCAVEAGLGTRKDSNGAIKPKQTTPQAGDPIDWKLTDASFDAVNKAFIIPDDGGENIAKIIPLANATENTQDANTNLFREDNIYSAFTWHMDFSILFGSTPVDIGLFFDANKSYVHKVAVAPTGGITVDAADKYYSDAACTTAYAAAATIAAGDTYYMKAPLDTGKGFRLAFVPEAYVPAENDTQNVNTSAERVTRVWAPHQEIVLYEQGDTIPDGKNVGDVKEENVKYITSSEVATNSTTLVPNTTTTLASKETSYVSPALMDKSYTTGVPGNGAVGAVATANNYLGTFASTGNAGKTVHLKFQVVAWYEGTDPTIVNTAETIYENVVSHLIFGAANMYVAPVQP